MELLLGWLSLGFHSGKRTIPYSHRYSERTTGSHAGRTLPSEPGTPRDPGPPWGRSTEQVTGEGLLAGVHSYPPWPLRAAMQASEGQEPFLSSHNQLLPSTPSCH